VFSWSYRSLADESARVFRLLGLHVGPDISLPAAASLAGVSQEQARRALGELTRAHLLTQHAPGRYAFHDLLRAYASERVVADEDDDARQAATLRLLDHYLHTGHAASMLLDPTGHPVILAPPEPGTALERLPDGRRALEWFETEHQVLMAAVARAASSGFDTHAWQISWIMAEFLDRLGRWNDAAATQRSALASASRLGDRHAQARTHRSLAVTCAKLGAFDESHIHFHRALDLYRDLGDRRGQAGIHLNWSNTFGRQGRHREALRQDELALELARAAGHRMAEAHAMNAIGWSHAQLGDYQQALAWCEQALTLERELGNRRGEASTWDSLGYAHHHLGDHVQAVACFERALALFGEIGSRYDCAEILDHLGQTRRAAGNPDAARQCWQQALTILESLHHPDADQVRAKLADTIAL
jgi:tetratricopeptide (TPR) repeat protein